MSSSHSNTPTTTHDENDKFDQEPITLRPLTNCIDFSLDKSDAENPNLSFQFKEAIVFKPLQNDNSDEERPSMRSSSTFGSLDEEGIPSQSPSRRPLQRTSRVGLKKILDEISTHTDSGRSSLQLDVGNAIDIYGERPHAVHINNDAVVLDDESNSNTIVSHFGNNVLSPGTSSTDYDGSVMSLSSRLSALFSSSSSDDDADDADADDVDGEDSDDNKNNNTNNNNNNIVIHGNTTVRYKPGRPRYHGGHFTQKITLLTPTTPPDGDDDDEKQSQITVSASTTSVSALGPTSTTTTTKGGRAIIIHDDNDDNDADYSSDGDDPRVHNIVPLSSQLTPIPSTSTTLENKTSSTPLITNIDTTPRATTPPTQSLSVKTQNIPSNSLPSLQQITPRSSSGAYSLSKNNRLGAYDRSVIFPVPPKPSNDDVTMDDDVMTPLPHELPHNKNSTTLKSILKQPKEVEKPFSIAFDNKRGKFGRSPISDYPTGTTPQSTTIRLRPLSNKSVTFLKPSTDRLELRVRVYEKQKEENYPIVVNPQKRPKRRGKGFFASVKSLFSKDGNNSNNHGRRGSQDLTSSGDLSVTTAAAATTSSSSSRRGSIQDTTVPGAMTPVQSASAPVTTPNLTPGTSPHIASTGKGKELPPLTLDRRGSNASQQPTPSPKHDFDVLSEDDDSDSEFDNDAPDCVYNTKVNSAHYKTEVADLLLAWEMFYNGFQEFVDRDSARFISFQE